MLLYFPVVNLLEFYFSGNSIHGRNVHVLRPANRVFHIVDCHGRYQTLSARNFSTFDLDYGFPQCAHSTGPIPELGRVFVVVRNQSLDRNTKKPSAESATVWDSHCDTQLMRTTARPVFEHTFDLRPRR